MNFKRNKKSLIKFKREMEKYSHLEKKEINSVVKWKNKLQKKVKTVSKIINLKDCDGWFLEIKIIYIIRVDSFLK